MSPLRRSSTQRAVAGLLAHVRYEVFPTPSIYDTVLSGVPREVTITVTTSPRKGLEPTLALAEKLSAVGYRVVPHLSARLLRDKGEVRAVAERLQSAGVVEVFVPAGDAGVPAGAFQGALEVLVELSNLPSRFERVGITGYPERHPQISDDVTIQSMWDKRHYADYIVSNLCFHPGTLVAWVRRVRARGVTLPLYLGFAGPNDPAKLVEMARKIGVSDSARFAGSHLRFIARLSASPGGYEPDRLLNRVAPALSDEALFVAGLHVFTFNQVDRAETWRRAHLERPQIDVAH